MYSYKNCICLLVILAVSDASDQAVIIGEPELPLGYTFGGLPYVLNSAPRTIVRANPGHGWGWDNPSYSYSYFTGGGWGSTPIYKDVPITYEPAVYNNGWGKGVPITYNNPGWGPTAPVPVYGYNTYGKGYGIPLEHPNYIGGNGWGQAPVPVVAVKSVGLGHGIPLVKSVVAGNGWAPPRYAGGYGVPYPSNLPYYK